MNKTLKLAACVASVALLAGCGSGAALTQYNNKYVPIPAALMVKCQQAAPPDYATYATASWPQKEQMWANVYATQANNTTVCNQRFTSLQTWNAQQALLYTGPASPAALMTTPTVTGDK